MLLIKQLLTTKEVSEYRAVLQQVPWLDGKATAMGMAAAVKRNGQADPNCADIKHLANQLLLKFGTNAQVVAAALPHRIFPPCFNRYAQGETYGFHVDAAIMRLPDNQIMRSDMSMTTFLSAPDEYIGGELVIQTPYGQQQIKLNAGDAVLYPSGSLHKVNPVTEGQRLAAITWIQSLIPDYAMRESLYELDQSIQALQQNSAVDRAELDRLHHVYHNLIRQHSQV